MSYADSVDFDVPQSGSHLLSESYDDLPSSSTVSSHAGHGNGHRIERGADVDDSEELSLEDLSLADRPKPLKYRPKFSLLAQPRQHAPLQDRDENAIMEDEDEEEDDGGKQGGVVFDRTMTQEDLEKMKKLSASVHEEKLQNDLFVLKKLNSALEVYKDALKEMKSSTEVCMEAVQRPCPLSYSNSLFSFQRVAVQIEQTTQLLNKYETILAKSENVTRLILDERWQGAEAVCPFHCTISYTPYVLLTTDMLYRMKKRSNEKLKRHSNASGVKKKNWSGSHSASENVRSGNGVSGRSEKHANGSVRRRRQVRSGAGPRVASEVCGERGRRCGVRQEGLRRALQGQVRVSWLFFKSE